MLESLVNLKRGERVYVTFGRHVHKSYLEEFKREASNAALRYVE